MIEIAISLAIIGFALVAIIGVLPIGMNVQKENREETIINQDATVFMNAIRNGAQGLDDLTNYVMAITNYVTVYDPTMTHTVGNPWSDGYTTTNSYATPSFPLTNGFRIIGLLSTPKYHALGRWKNSAAMFISNHVVAYVRAHERARQREVSPEQPVHAGPRLQLSPDLGSRPLRHQLLRSQLDQLQRIPGELRRQHWRYNYWQVANSLQANLHDLRLTFRWPLLSRGRTGHGRPDLSHPRRRPASPDQRVRLPEQPCSTSISSNPEPT